MRAECCELKFAGCQNGGSDFLRFSSILKPEIKLKRVQGIFKYILVLGLVKFQEKKRRKTKNTIFRHDFEVQVGDIAAVVYFTRNWNFRFEFSVKVETLCLQGICMNLRIKGRGFSSFKFKNGKARHGSSVGLSCLTWLLLK